MTKHRILAAAAAAALCLAGCGDHGAKAPADDASIPSATQAPAAPSAAPAEEPAPATPAVPSDGPLQVADIDAYFRGMGREVELLQAEFRKIEQARAAGDSDAETTALFAMTSNDIDTAGAQAAGMAPARYAFVKDRIDTVQSKLDLLEGFRKMDGDTSAMQAQVGDPYAALPADVAVALKARQAQAAALRAEAIGLRVKAAGG